MPHDNDTHSMRVNAVITNPHITDWFFHMKLSDFVHHWLQQTLDAEWHWYRYEYQSRGSTHAHGCAKLKNDPGLCQLVSTAALGWLEEEKNKDAVFNNTELPQNHHIIAYSQQAKLKAIQYADWLVTTINNDIPDETWRPPNPHPCTLKLNDIPTTSCDSDYQSLVNCVQRHTRCNAAYCLRRKNGKEPTCRFGYPIEQTPTTTVTFERLSNGQVKATLTTSRNDPRINSHNRLMLQHWRANVDLQVIVDVNACARYMTKYIAKSEQRSKSASDILSHSISCSTTTPSILRKCMIQSVGERDFSAQETAHLILSLPLYRCTYNFVTLSLNANNFITTDSSTSEENIINPSILDKYSNRSQYSNSFPCITTLNLLQFAATYSITKTNELIQWSHPVIVKTFPTYSSDPKGPNYTKYCKYQLIKFKPWLNFIDTLWENDHPTDDTYISAYRDFLQTDFAHTNISQYSVELERAEHYIHTHDNNSSDDEDDYEYQSVSHQEEWMLLCQVNPTYQQDLPHNANVDWEAAAKELPIPLLQSCPNWIMHTKAQYSNITQPSQQVDLTKLNRQQNKAYNIVARHFSNRSIEQSPLLMMVLGTAGTGKSYLTKALTQLLGQVCLITATTGMAAFQIAGITLHSGVQLPIQSHNKKDLSGTLLAHLQHMLKNITYIIIDEVSMLGQKGMEWTDKRL